MLVEIVAHTYFMWLAQTAAAAPPTTLDARARQALHEVYQRDLKQFEQTTDAAIEEYKTIDGTRLCKRRDPVGKKLCEDRKAYLEKQIGYAVTSASPAPAPTAVTPPVGARPVAEKTETEKELDRLKSGKLIRWGVTGGVGPAFYAPLHISDGMTSVPGAGALPYVMFHPVYWSSAIEQNIYCANQWSGQESVAAASRAADDAAKLRAERTVDVLLVQARAGVLTRSVDVTDTVCPGGGCQHDADRLRSLAFTALNADTDAGKNAKAALVEAVQRHTLDWISGIPAGCKSRNFFGLWVGYPLKFTATVPYQVGMGETKRGRLDITPLVAFGYGISPNAYVSILAGLALGKTNLPPGGDNDDELVVSFVLGLGGNLDLLGLFTK